MTRRIKLSALLLGCAVLIAATFSAGQIDQASAVPPGPPSSVPVEVVNVPLPVTGLVDVNVTNLPTPFILREILTTMTDTAQEETVTIQETVLIHDIYAQNTVNRDGAGCFLLIRNITTSQTFVDVLFLDQDPTRVGNGEIYQQRLGHGYLIEADDEIEFEFGIFTSDDFTPAGPFPSCSTTVFFYGEVVE